ncbi:hypothetical protein LCGC14_0843440 [marine sediment metagenome]|uniref:Uncharacterized protein n=1 Tax=marine sediment metagenome TaxID=412755 RepID=A0A0F9PH50_9ZZZZ
MITKGIFGEGCFVKIWDKRLPCNWYTRFLVKHGGLNRDEAYEKFASGQRFKQRIKPVLVTIGFIGTVMTVLAIIGFLL